MAATLIFAAVSLAVVLAWNALFRPIPWRIVLGIYVAIALYQDETLFTGKVDLPGGLAYRVYPWKALNREPVRANTGIAFQELIAWTETAREIVKSGEVPLWNRRLGAGTPLLSDQQHAIAHPFTLLGLYLPIGKAWTLSVALRLFFALLFFFVFLRNQDVHEGAAFFGAIAYGFSVFHIVTLLMALGLTMMMLPMTLAAADELLRRPRGRSFAFTVAALAMTVLGGHPEAELFVGLTTGVYALYLAFVLRGPRRLLLAAAAAVCALLLTAFFWYPTAAVVKMSNRYALMTALRGHAPPHQIGRAWLTVLVSPNILGTVPANTYRPPEPRSPDLLDDYGEVACGYTGIATLALALAALPLAWRRRPGMFAAGAIVFALLMITETPGWHALVQRIPALNVALLQRFRFLWNLGIVILAVIGLDAFLRGELARRRVVFASIATGIVLVIVLATGVRDAAAFELVQLLAPCVVLALLPFVARMPFALAALTFLELVLTTWRYNPPSAPADVLPVTGAIAAMRANGEPYRILARGYSFLPDTPGYYGLEDVKSTSPFSSPEYLRLFTGYLDTTGFDQVAQRTSPAFVDYLNVRFIYAPPRVSPARDDLVEIYRGADGAVFRNDRVLPRYFLVRHFDVELSYGMTVAKMRELTDYRARAFVDHIPAKVQRLAPELAADMAGGDVRVLRYGPNDTELAVESRGWNLLVSSDEWWPGWRAYWNGERMPHVRVNGAFTGVFVPPGRGIVRLRYRPREFDHGVAAGAATLLLLAGAAVIHAGLRKRRYASAAQSAAAA